MTKDEILKRVKKFQGANREFSQELPPIIEGLVDLIDEAGPEVVDNLTSNSPTKALSANMGKELKLMVDGKVSEPETAGTAGQILQLDEEGNPEWVDAAEVGATYDSTVSDTSTNAIQNKTIKKYVDDNFAQKDGYYASLTAGAAENIVGQSAIEGTFLFRTTAGDADISNGVATVEAVKGNTVAWNQGVAANPSTDTSGLGGEITLTKNSDGSLTLNGAATENRKFIIYGCAQTGHAMLYLFDKAYPGLSLGDGYTGASAGVQYLIKATAQTNNLHIGIASGTVLDNLTIRVNTHDLTLMFGAGNEPTTVAAFESWLAANVGSRPYYPASSKLLSTKLLKYVSRGFNQWDEQWEVGAYNPDTGQPIVGDGQIRSKTASPIPVLPNTEYCFTCLGARVSQIYWYDAEGNFISRSQNSTASAFTATSPAAARFCKFQCPTAYGTTYNHDICINLSWDGSRDGEYEPYVEYEYNLDVTKFYGKLNGEGDLTQIFPGGMRKADHAGTVRDLLSLKDAEADVKVGEVDLGDLEWTYSSGQFYASMPASSAAPVSGYGIGSICSKYTRENAAGLAAGDKCYVCNSLGMSSSKIIYVKDSAYTDAAAFATAIDGVELYFELATPPHYTDLVYRDNGVDTPVEALNVIVNNWSTEEEIIAAPEASGDPNSCAATLDILYGIDAAEQLDTINQSGIFTDDLKANLEALIGVINTNCAGVLGGTLSISDTPTDKVYTFTFTPTTEGE